MSIDRSLKIAGGLTRHRNVLTRAERIAKLNELEVRSEDDSAFGLPKVAHRNLKVGKKTKEKKEEGTADATAKEAAK